MTLTKNLVKKMRKEIFISLFPSDWKNFHLKSISTSSTRIVTRFYQKRKKSSSKQSKIGGPNLMISVHWTKETTNVWFSRRKSRQAAIPSVGFWMKVMRMNLVKRERGGGEQCWRKKNGGWRGESLSSHRPRRIHLQATLWPCRSG